MGALFSPDSKFSRVMSRVGDLLLLNVIFLITSIPIVTAGASLTALYTVCFRFGTEKEGKIVRTYFKAFKENFKQSTLLWLILLIFGVASAFNAYSFYVMPGTLHWCFVFFSCLFALIVLTAGYTFPLLSQFSNSVASTFKNALIFSVGYLPRSLLMAVFNVLPFALLLLDPYRFLQLGALWLALYFAAAAYVNSALLKKVFAPYMTEENKEEEIPE